MQKIFGIFFQPFPIEENRRIQFLNSLIVSGAVVIILFLFKPFGLAEVMLPLFKIIPVYIGYGIVTLLVCLLADKIIRPAFPSFFDDQNWNVMKHILWTVFTIMLIGLGNLFYSRMLGFTGISGSTLLSFQVYTFFVAIFPVTLVTMVRMLRLLSINLKKAKELNNQISTPVTGVIPETPLIFISDSGKDEIRLKVDQFMYAESADNYTDIVYVENGIVRRALIRSSLKRVAEMNTAPFIVRVHRAFLVNMRKVKSVTGNAQGYRLAFDYIDETIPVSRRNTNQVKELLTGLHNQQP